MVGACNLARLHADSRVELLDQITMHYNHGSIILHGERKGHAVKLSITCKKEGSIAQGKTMVQQLLFKSYGEKFAMIINLNNK
jgi:hypothetical protein